MPVPKLNSPRKRQSFIQKGLDEAVNHQSSTLPPPELKFSKVQKQLSMPQTIVHSDSLQNREADDTESENVKESLANKKQESGSVTQFFQEGAWIEVLETTQSAGKSAEAQAFSGEKVELMNSVKTAMDSKKNLGFRVKDLESETSKSIEGVRLKKVEEKADKDASTMKYDNNMKSLKTALDSEKRIQDHAISFGNGRNGKKQVTTKKVVLSESITIHQEELDLSDSLKEPMEFKTPAKNLDSPDQDFKLKKSVEKVETMETEDFYIKGKLSDLEETWKNGESTVMKECDEPTTMKVSETKLQQSSISESMVMEETKQEYFKQPIEKTKPAENEVQKLKEIVQSEILEVEQQLISAVNTDEETRLNFKALQPEKRSILEDQRKVEESPKKLQKEETMEVDKLSDKRADSDMKRATSSILESKTEQTTSVEIKEVKKQEAQKAEPRDKQESKETQKLKKSEVDKKATKKDKAPKKKVEDVPLVCWCGYIPRGPKNVKLRMDRHLKRSGEKYGFHCKEKYWLCKCGYTYRGDNPKKGMEAHLHGRTRSHCPLFKRKKEALKKAIKKSRVIDESDSEPSEGDIVKRRKKVIQEPEEPEDDDEYKYPCCGVIGDDENMQAIQCDDCQKWWHTKCLVEKFHHNGKQLAKTISVDTSKWYCHECKPIKKKSKAVPKKKAASPKKKSTSKPKSPPKKKTASKKATSKSQRSKKEVIPKKKPTKRKSSAKRKAASKRKAAKRKAPTNHSVRKRKKQENPMPKIFIPDQYRIPSKKQDVKMIAENPAEENEKEQGLLVPKFTFAKKELYWRPEEDPERIIVSTKNPKFQTGRWVLIQHTHHPVQLLAPKNGSPDDTRWSVGNNFGHFFISVDEGKVLTGFGTIWGAIENHMEYMNCSRDEMEKMLFFACLLYEEQPTKALEYIHNVLGPKLVPRWRQLLYVILHHFYEEPLKVVEGYEKMSEEEFKKIAAIGLVKKRTLDSDSDEEPRKTRTRRRAPAKKKIASRKGVKRKRSTREKSKRKKKKTTKKKTTKKGKETEQKQTGQEEKPASRRRRNLNESDEEDTNSAGKKQTKTLVQ